MVDQTAARIMQGMPGYGGPSPKAGRELFNTVKKVWAHPVTQKVVIQGGAVAEKVGNAARNASDAGRQILARPSTGPLGWLVNFWPENVYGWFMFGALFIYILDLRLGAAVTGLHLYFAVGSFVAIGLLRGFFNMWLILAAVFMYFALMGLAGAETIKERAVGIFVIAVSIAIFNMKTRATGAYKMIPVIAFLDVYGMPIIAAKVLEIGRNIEYIPYVIAFITNGILFPVWLWFGMLAFSQNPQEGREGTRVAGRFLSITIIFYLIVFLPQIKEIYVKDISPELRPIQTAQADSVIGRFRANLRSIMAGDFLDKPVTDFYSQAEKAFGWGEAKPQPKMGLQLSQNPQLPTFTLYRPIRPSAIMRVPNPFPAEFKADKRKIDVIGIDCTLEGKEGIVVEPETPLQLFSGMTKKAVCEFAANDVEAGENRMNLLVKYKFVMDSDMFTTFMLRERINEQMLAGNLANIDSLAASKKAVPPSASFDNFPISIRWPEEFRDALVGIDIGKNDKSKPFTIGLFVSKTGTWTGDIYGIEKLSLTLAEGFELVNPGGENCDFDQPLMGSYPVKEELIRQKGTVAAVGKGTLFECKMTMDLNEFARKGEIRPANFKAIGHFIFGTDITVPFEAEGGIDITSSDQQAGVA